VANAQVRVFILPIGDLVGGSFGASDGSEPGLEFMGMIREQIFDVIHFTLCVHHW